MSFPDLFVESIVKPSVAPQQMAAAATVNGASVAVEDCESVVLQLDLGSLAGAPTGGTITLTPQESPDGVTWNQVNGTDSVVANYNDTLPEVLRYRYIGGANGKQPYVRVSVTTALTGGTSPTINVSGTVLLGGLRFAGKQPTAGAYPQTPGSSITN